jgi:hypothetical protein
VASFHSCKVVPCPTRGWGMKRRLQYLRSFVTEDVDVYEFGDGVTWGIPAFTDPTVRFTAPTNRDWRAVLSMKGAQE